MTLRIQPSAEVAEALQRGRPVVALESTIISHGFPRPRNLEVGRMLEGVLREAGVTPATVAVVDGALRVGLTEGQLERMALDDTAVKVSQRDLGTAVARKVLGATTVAATSVLATRAGIRVFATGGLGGVHRDARTSFDESADLATLSRTPITVVAAGVKSILDIPATLERLESLNVAVVGYRTTAFPGFWLTDSGAALDWSVSGPAEVAEIMQVRDALDDPAALVVANPIPVERQLDPALHDRVLGEALAEAERRGVHGKAVTPFLLDFIQRATGGLSLDVNIEIARNNAKVAAEIATAWAAARGDRA